MRAIYTKLTRSEVQEAIHNAANKAGIAFSLTRLSKEVQLGGSDFNTLAKGSITSFLETVSKAIDVVPWRDFVDNKVGSVTKRLTRHCDSEIQRQASEVYCLMRSRFAASKVASRGTSSTC